ncbi:MAG TPA: hypothetical protein VEP90_15300, partial [Methylomirabilota bacterium]|nr:hypothetical protein [Methylomirabilota bacterium]
FNIQGRPVRRYRRTDETAEELAHALEVARQIGYLGGDPTVKVKDAEFSQDSERMLTSNHQALLRENQSSGTLWNLHFRKH